MSLPYPVIAVEEHWVSQAVRDLYVARGAQDPNDEKGLVGMFTPALMELGEKRLESMDKGSVTLQVVSHAPNTIALDLSTCIKVNDELSELIQANPGRFAGFATLPMADSKAAAKELRRCVRELKFVGALIDSNCEGRFYDDSFFWPVFEAAEELQVPIYLHPSPNEHTKHLLYDGNYSGTVAETLSQYVWGWHTETAIHFLRLFGAGLFDRYPKLQLVLGHQGEMLPFQLDRIEHITSRWPNLERHLRQVWDENVWVAISGLFYMAPMTTVLMQCKPDRIMYAVDYPFGKNEAGLEFLKTLKSGGHVKDDVLEGIAYKNAENLLKIKASSR